jgi:hypothetical protein
MVVLPPGPSVSDQAITPKSEMFLGFVTDP